ncbi:unnamed protein product [Protopolystoma xenopodis]|uniref:Uncharacterized protein n=1 Tax=Protopolystoma xenopodis TaxID=117903 RepID=A0A3S5FC62_9PLAT|nr:unnamed protein product [Protopolystoma xenopodis]
MRQQLDELTTRLVSQAKRSTQLESQLAEIQTRLHLEMEARSLQLTEFTSARERERQELLDQQQRLLSSEMRRSEEALEREKQRAADEIKILSQKVDYFGFMSNTENS